MEIEPRTSVRAVSSSSTTSPSTSTTLATWWSRTPAWKTVRGYWARNRWSGKMVWHTYTTGGSSPSTPTTASGFQPVGTTSAPPTRTSKQTTSSKTAPTTSKTSTTEADYGGGGGEWRRDPQGEWIWYPSINAAVTTEDLAESQTLSSSRFSTTSTTVSLLSTTKAEPPSTTVSRHIQTTTRTPSEADRPQRGDASNRTNRTFTAVTQPNILPGPSTRAQSVVEKSPTEGRNVIFVVVTSTTERGRPSPTIEDDSDENGRKFIYVTPHATGLYAKAFEQFIRTPAPNPGRMGRNPWNHGPTTRRPGGKRRSYPGESARFETPGFL